MMTYDWSFDYTIDGIVVAPFEGYALIDAGPSGEPHIDSIYVHALRSGQVRLTPAEPTYARIMVWLLSKPKWDDIQAEWEQYVATLAKGEAT